MIYQGDESQRANLLKLADYLATWKETEKDKFNMLSYARQQRRGRGIIGPTSYCDATKTCGTVACALGHGPAAGIDPDGIQTWPTYSYNKFGLSSFSILWTYAFGSEWYFIPGQDTARAAAMRIYIVLAGKDITRKDFPLAMARSL